eukprot:1606077-Pyramimonas_sp.AAC.1
MLSKDVGEPTLDNTRKTKPFTRLAMQMTMEGREELAAFETAPLLMDGQKDRASGACCADGVNVERLYQ